MTKERAIRLARQWSWGGVTTLQEGEAQEYHKLALSALLAQQERENPQPLTSDELQQMDGDPVWIIWPDGRIKSQWWIVNSANWHMMEFNDDCKRGRYGKEWIAYSYKLTEGVTHESKTR